MGAAIPLLLSAGGSIISGIQSADAAGEAKKRAEEAQRKQESLMAEQKNKEDLVEKQRGMLRERYKIRKFYNPDIFSKPQGLGGYASTLGM